MINAQGPNWAAKTPGSNQSTNAFENDIIEFYGDFTLPVDIRWSLHDWNRSGQDVWNSVDASTYGQSEIDYPMPADYATAYHKYGVLWDSTHLTYFLDRVQIGQRLTPPVMQDIGYMIINLGMRPPLDLATNPNAIFHQRCNGIATKPMTASRTASRKAKGHDAEVDGATLGEWLSMAMRHVRVNAEKGYLVRVPGVRNLYDLKASVTGYCVHLQ